MAEWSNAATTYRGYDSDRMFVSVKICVSNPRNGKQYIEWDKVN